MRNTYFTDRMKRFSVNIVFFILLLMQISCVREDLVEPTIGKGMTWVDLKFGHKDFEAVNISTKATLDPIPESRVSNMYAYIFVGETRVYAHYFDHKDLALSNDGLHASENEAWIVNQYNGDSITKTNGTLHIHAPVCSGAEIYLIANIDSDMLNISPEKLNLITTKSELMELISSLNQEITSRNGLFPMAGLLLTTDTNGTPQLGKVDITNVGIVPAGQSSGTVTIELNRFDAKINVKVRVATDYELTSTDDATGVTTVQTLKEFRPESWQVVNLPKGSYIAPHADTDKTIGYFSTEPVHFETATTETFSINGKDVTSEVDGFSFYMLENHVKAKKIVTSFAEREKKNKDSDGKFDTTDGIWKNAPEDGTYLIIKGEVVMDVDVSSEAKQQDLAADVTYYVHLGDFKTDLNNYDVDRNTVYNYTITIKGVNNIKVEVESSQAGSPDDVIEKQPGAEGMVYTAKESIYTFDAHYGQRVFCFDAAYIDPAAVTWYVRTPFGKEGIPDKIGDVEIPSGMDYKWVELMRNDVAATTDYTYTYSGKTKTASLAIPAYSHNNLHYPGVGSDKLMDIVDFVRYIKEQTNALREGKENEFRKEFDQDWFDWYNRNHPEAPVTDPSSNPDGPWFRDRIYVTIFVNEFYYEENPITGEKEEGLWKRFVNQPNRLMHILCDSEKSIDEASSSTGSVVTIRQRSIQTPYNIDDPDLISAWGCETEDENADSYLWYYPSERDTTRTGLEFKDLGNTSNYNGLYNTARIWGCISGSTWNDGMLWDTYLDYDRENDHNLIFLHNDYASLKYSAMMRNRDNNGNGKIDPDEIRWYTASIGQLEFLFLGELGLNDAAKLYPRKYANAPDEKYTEGPYAGIKKWKVHTISSTQSNYNQQPSELWNEESVSVSGYKQWITTSVNAYSTKCVRNLGFKDTRELTSDDFMYDREEDRPQDLVIVTKPTLPVTNSNAVYKFDCRRINNKSKRFRTSIELEPYDENSEMARLYDGFETGELFPAVNVGINNYKNLRNKLQSGERICPNGYRVPNLREAVLIYLMADDSKEWWGYTEGGASSLGVNYYRFYTSTYYSMGSFGNKKNEYAQKNPVYADGKPVVDENGNQVYSYVYRTSWNTLSPLFGSEGNINLNGDVSRQIRCVRDWNPDTDN